MRTNQSFAAKVEINYLHFLLLMLKVSPVRVEDELKSVESGSKRNEGCQG
jgi:hypothetical protein